LMASERVTGARNATAHWGQLEKAVLGVRAAAVNWGQARIIVTAPRRDVRDTRLGAYREGEVFDWYVVLGRRYVGMARSV
jgi:hypothetical protein